MNLDLTPDQQAILGSVETALKRVLVDVDPKKYLHQLAGGGFLDLASETSVLDAELLVEAAAEMGAVAPFASRLIVAPMLGAGDMPELIGLLEGRSGLVRFGQSCEAFLILDGERVLLASASDVDVEPLGGTLGYPYAAVHVQRVTELGPDLGGVMRRAWRISIAAEAAGCMRAAVALTSDYVSRRFQFGRALGSFQAVQHRLARAYTYAQGTTWLARRAAWHHTDEYLAACAATYACQGAAEVFSQTHQVSGGIGITSEHGLTAHTHRLLALQRELGGVEAHARAATRARAKAPVAARRT